MNISASVHTPERLSSENFQEYKNRRAASNEIRKLQLHPRLPKIQPKLPEETDRGYLKRLFADFVVRTATDPKRARRKLVRKLGIRQVKKLILSARIAKGLDL